MVDSGDLTGPRYFSIWDYVVFAIMLLISALIGIFSACTGGRQRTADEFLVGNRNMNIFPVAMSLAISYISAVSVIGTPGEIYIYGTMFSWVVVANALFPFFMYRLFLPTIFRIKVISIYEYLELRFSRSVRLSVNIAYSIQLLLYMGVVIYTPAITINAVTGFSLWACILSTGFVCIFYTAVGGIKAVLWTDALQGCIMIIGVTAVIIKGTMEVGGLDQVWKIAEKGNRIHFLEIDPDPTILYSVWSMLIGLTCFGLSTNINQVLAQRLLSCGTIERATKALVLAAMVKVVIFSLCIFSGVVMYAYYVNCDPLTQGVVSSKDQIMPLMVVDLFSKFPGVPGLFLSAVLSASLSTLSSGINALAAITAEDVIKPVWPKLRPHIYARITKIFAVLYGLIVIACAFVTSLINTGVTQFALSLLGMMAGALLGVFVLGVFMHRCNAKGALVGFLTSVTFMIWIKVGAIIYPSTRGQYPLLSDGCPVMNATSDDDSVTSFDYTTVSLPTIGSNLEPPERPAIASLYDVSYVYYTPIGCIVCVIVAMIISGLTGFNDPYSIDNRLKYNLTDALFCCFPERAKKWMRCGVDKIVYDEDYTNEKNEVVVENINEASYKKFSAEGNSSGYSADPPEEMKESIQ